LLVKTINESVIASSIRSNHALEIISAALIALPAGRVLGMTLGAIIIAAAIVTILRHRDFSHTPPLGEFAALFMLVARHPEPLGLPANERSVG
jgi:hypothetical protein